MWMMVWKATDRLIFLLAATWDAGVPELCFINFRDITWVRKININKTLRCWHDRDRKNWKQVYTVKANILSNCFRFMSPSHAIQKPEKTKTKLKLNNVSLQLNLICFCVERTFHSLVATSNIIFSIRRERRNFSSSVCRCSGNSIRFTFTFLCVSHGESKSSWRRKKFLCWK